MGTGIEAAGDAMTGAAIARAVEPGHGEATGGGAACLNCGAALDGPYCAHCGQAAHLHRSLGGLWHDIAHGVFHFEGKVWRTLPMLAAKPGALTRRYIHGERARFVSPLALFLFSVFLMFAVFGTVGGPFGAFEFDSGQFSADMRKAVTDQRALVGRLTRERAAASVAARSALDARLAQEREELRDMETARAVAQGTGGGLVAERMRIDLGSAVRDAQVRKALENPGLLLYKMQNSAYKFAWAIIPLSLPFMWLMFAWKRDLRMYDHAVFVTYSLSAVILLLVLMALLAALGIGADWMLLLAPVHFFLQLKGAYALRTASALWRTIALLVFAFATLVIFGTALLALGLLG